MKNWHIRLVAILLPVGVGHVAAASLEDDFRNPPVVMRPYVWWHWMGSNISKEGITKDLESMKASGIGGATIFNLTSAVMAYDKPTKNLPFPDITYRSPKWWEMVCFAASEAQRLGLEIGMHNCVGYSATGGPWVTPELSMQHVVFTSTPVDGPKSFSGVLPQAKATLGFYRDIAVLAVPTGNPVDTKGILDLSGKMGKDGRISWNAPVGKWLIYRFGHTSTGKSPHPIPEDVKALEVDKMGAEASRFHFEQVLNPLKDHLGPLMGKSFRHITFDSYEAGKQNWTPAFRQEFIRQKGYDPVPWLPLLDGKVVGSGKKATSTPNLTLGSPEQSARFLWDFNDMIARLYQQNNFEQGVRMINRAGLLLQFEAYSGPFDTIAGSAIADIPMGEFWTGGAGAIGPQIVGAAHAAGKNVIGAEALTGSPGISKFSEHPATLKITGDGGYASGVNRLVLHHWVHQPFGDAFKPGMGMGWWGTHFGRNQTWAEPGKAYFQYLGRTQAMLQHGEAVADFLTLEHARANADAIPRETLLRGDVRVENGRIVLPCGRSYPFLVLPDRDVMLPEVARRLRDLVKAGAVIVGKRPVRSPGLSGYPACDDEVSGIGVELWGNADGKSRTENSVGKGKVFAGSPAQLLDKSGITPSVSFTGKSSSSIRSTARRDGASVWYFISNGTNASADITASFRVHGMLPEIWQAEDGSRAPAGVWRVNGGRTEVPLHLRGKESLFVVFRKAVDRDDHPVDLSVGGTGTLSDPMNRNDATDGPVRELSADANGRPVLVCYARTEGDIIYASGKRVRFSADPAAPRGIVGAWEVSFAPGMGAPDKTTFAELKSWSEHADGGIRYYSGTATYRKSFEVPAGLLGGGKRLVLDLGAVSNLASVKINGIAVGVLWYAPFRVNATPAIKAGTNTLEIAVTNTWANRLIGDEQEPADVEWGELCSLGKNVAGRPLVSYPDWFVKGHPRPSKGRKAFSTWNYFTKDSPLLPAGLLGPVVIRPAQETKL